MDELPLRRDGNGEIQLAGTGAVTLRIVYDSVLGTGGQGVIFMREILGRSDSHVIMKVAAKVPRVVQDSLGELRAEAEKHAKAWMELDNVLLPFGFMAAHDETGTPPVLLTKIGGRLHDRIFTPTFPTPVRHKPLDAFLTEAGPLPYRSIEWIKAIARVVFQLLQFSVSADAINLLHRDIKMENMFVMQSYSLELARLAVGNFEAAQRGEKMADGSAVYYAGDYAWNTTSSRMASTVYEAIAGTGAPRETVRLDRQLCLYDDLFGWARIAFTAVASHPPPDILLGPTTSDYARAPELGYGDVMDAVHHLKCFALNLMTSGRIDDTVDAKYINSMECYRTLPDMF